MNIDKYLEKHGAHGTKESYNKYIVYTRSSGRIVIITTSEQEAMSKMKPGRKLLVPLHKLERNYNQPIVHHYPGAV